MTSDSTHVLSSPATTAGLAPRRLHPRWIVATAAFILIALWLSSTTKTIPVKLPTSNIGAPTSIGIDAADAADDACVCGDRDDDAPSSLAATLGLHGNVSDCCCSFADLEAANAATVRPLLQRVVATPFFSHFKVDLCSDCPLWDDAPLCMLRDCGVCECDEPPGWAAEVEWMPKTGPGHDCAHVDDRVVTSVSSRLGDNWMSPSSSFLDGGVPMNTDGSTSDSDDRSDAVVVDLRVNPERYTGYGGASAEKVWSAIHSDNCFEPPEPSLQEGEGEDYAENPAYCSLPAEQRIYNRIISGLHSSISLHIAHSYCVELDPDRIGECRRWGANATIARERVLDRAVRLENLYAAFALLLRAVQKAGPAVAAAVPREDAFFADSISEWTGSLLPEIAELARSCPVTFDESNLLVDDGVDVEAKRSELQRRFRQLQRIMQCVGCDRCRLWGTLQTLGIGTALRVLLDEEGHNSDGASSVKLSRQEPVALVHSLERFSSALVFAQDLKR